MSKGIHWSDDVKLAVVTQWNNNVSTAAIAERHATTPNTILGAIHRMRVDGFEPMPIRRPKNKNSHVVHTKTFAAEPLVWTDAKTQDLRNRWNVAGESANHIAKMLGVSRQAVMGKVKRMREAGEDMRTGFVKGSAMVAVKSVSPSVRKPSEGPVTGYNITRTTVKDTDRINELTVIGQRRVKAIEAEQTNTGVTLLELGNRCCRWATGSRGTDTLFCGEPATSKSYCDTHAKRVYVRSAA